METKKCTKCKQVKPVSDFHKDKGKKDGLSWHCKLCAKAKVKEWQQNNRERVNNGQNKRRNANPEKHRAYKRKWNKSHLDSVKKTVGSYRKNNPERVRAWEVVNRHLREGRLVRQPCRVCGSKKTEGHHESYDKPLEVDWLCRRHHMEHHRNH